MIVSSLLGLLLPMMFLATMRMLYVEEGWRSIIVAWLSCGDTSLVTWADSQEARRKREIITFLISHSLISFSPCSNNWFRQLPLFYMCLAKRWLVKPMITWFVLALDIVSCDRAVTIKAHGPAKSYGSIFNLSDLHLWRVGWFWVNVCEKERKWDSGQVALKEKWMAGTPDGCIGFILSGNSAVTDFGQDCKMQESHCATIRLKN